MPIAADSETWQCQFCTFHNEKNKTMKCKMCQKINPFKLGIVGNKETPKRKRRRVPNPKCLKPKVKVEENEKEQIKIEKPMLSLLDYWKMSDDEDGYRKVDAQSLD